MQRRRVGTSGLEVSRLALGTMTWSRDTSAEEAADQLDMFLDAGGTLLDTAATYAEGGSESLIGALLTGAVSRDDVQICTKAGIRRTPSGGLIDASRDTMLDTLDASLTRLGTDHVDLWLVHAFDAITPSDETLHALEIAVNSGRARYVGVSNYPGWATARIAAQATGRPAISATQMEYSLLQRGIEREVVPAARSMGVGVLAWSPLGRGVLTGKYRHAVPADSRAASEHLAGFVDPYLGERSRTVVDALATAADGLGMSSQEVALAWVLSREWLASAIVGARTAHQLAPSLEAADLELPSAILGALDEVTAPELGYPERR
ncbi:aldo/keto reductase [Demequina zhanjiangensis]|uniref:Aldo/keto reductase n=1 Tax=Demequina zhanjiangensis TaxID=3051659 RepID=A0ABT8G356_9MICO|nr:aldo/keto reductase [Demequina sp. SYSU T00b26]MDN4473119.1 aldo/keto reductase [Demequina sp. SYSU T00b26]